MATNLVMCDTNIFIHWFNGDEQTIQQLRKIGLENVALSVITAMELIQGADNKLQLRRLRQNMNNYSIVNFSAEVSELSLRFVEDYKLSHHLQIPMPLLPPPPFTIRFRYLPIISKILSIFQIFRNMIIPRQHNEQCQIPQLRFSQSIPRIRHGFLQLEEARLVCL